MSRNRGGYTLVELVIGLAIIAVLGATASVGYASYIERATRAPMFATLDQAVQMQQQLRAGGSDFVDLGTLQARGFSPATDVVVEEVQVVRDRLYMRVKHSKSERRCSVDYSPVSSRATNRKVCFNGLDDPAAEAPRLADAVETAVPTTTTVGAPTDPPVTSLTGLLAPLVGDAADQVTNPGVTATQTFQVTNRSGTTRVFDFAATTNNPAVVISTGASSALTLASGASGTVTVTYGVEPTALADAIAQIALRATDRAAPAYVGDGVFRVTTALLLGYPLASAPVAETRNNGETFAVSYSATNRTNGSRVLEHLSSLLAGSPLSVVPNTLAPEAMYSAWQQRPVGLSYTLNAPFCSGGQTFNGQLTVRDKLAPSYATTTTPSFAVTVRPVIGAPSVVAPAAREGAAPGSEFTMRWQVSHASNLSRDVTITPTATADLEVVRSSHSGAVTVGCQQTLEVDVTYRLRPGSVQGTVSTGSLGVSLPGGTSTTQTVSVTTPLVLAAPSMDQPTNRNDQPGTTFVQQMSVTNNSNGVRSLVFGSGSNTDVDLQSLTVDGAAVANGGAVSFPAFGTKILRVTYRLRDPSVSGTVSTLPITVADQLVPNPYTTPRQFTETTALQLCAPTIVSGPTGVPVQPQMPGTRARVQYVIGNCSNAPRPLSFSATSPNPGAAQILGVTQPGTVAAYSNADVYIDYEVPVRALGTATSGVTVQASDAEAGASPQGGFGITVARVIVAPTFAFAQTQQEVVPGAAGSMGASVSTLSNVPTRVCYSLGVAAGNQPAGNVVSTSATAPGCTDLAPFAEGVATPAFGYPSAGAALRGWSNVIQSAACNEEGGACSANASFSVMAGLRLSEPTIRGPQFPVEWFVGDEKEFGYRITNTSNDTRVLCVRHRSENNAALYPIGGDGPDNCSFSLAPGASADLSRWFRAVAQGFNIGATGMVYDQGAEQFNARTRHDNTILPKVKVGPKASFTVTGEDGSTTQFWTRKWASFDPAASAAGEGGPIVKWTWRWGMSNSQWSPTSSRFEAGTGEATDEMTSGAAVRRAWDAAGTYDVCLVVTDQEGLTGESCQPVKFDRETRARLTWFYNPTWEDHNYSLTPNRWFGNDHQDHGQANYGFDANPSRGGVGISSLYMILEVSGTDESSDGKWSTYLTRLVGQPAPLDLVIERCGEEEMWGLVDNPVDDTSVWCRENMRRMRVIPGVYPNTHTFFHTMSQHIWLGRKGVAGRYVEKKPVHSRATLVVVDANGRETRDTRNIWHGDWSESVKQEWAQQSPSAHFANEQTVDGVTTVTGLTGTSLEGRVTGVWFEVEVSDGTPAGTTTTVIRGRDSYVIEQPQCGHVMVTPYATDDLGQSGYGVSTTVAGSEGSVCGGEGPGGVQPTL